jgi:signal transduction histidine kinase
LQTQREELAAANEELTAINDELHLQREELQATLNKLKQTQKQLVSSEKMASLGLLAAGVAHEINNPLNFIKGGVLALENYVNDNLKNQNEHFAPLLEIINVGVTRAADIITSLNHYSRKDDSKISEVNICSVIDNCLLMLRNQIKNRITVDKKYPNKPFNILCNEGKMHQALLNILTNSVHAIPDTGNISIDLITQDDFLEVVISDTGCGIPQEHISKLTDPFFTTKEPGKGTGLGLSITQNIIDEHMGTLEFESEIEQGTTVTIKFPFKNK